MSTSYRCNGLVYVKFIDGTYGWAKEPLINGEIIFCTNIVIKKE